ncbi:hypothetical protein ACHAXT_006309 [Thalassiosira profunda]
MTLMGAALSLACKRGPLAVEKRVKYLRDTPFFQYLDEETIIEFARCFSETVRTSGGLTLDPQKIYVVCEGEVDLSTSYPSSKGRKVEAKGYLCRKRRGDIVNVCSTRMEVERRMTVQSLKNLAEDVKSTTVGSGGSGSVLLLSADMTALNGFAKNHPELPIVECLNISIEDRLLSLPFLRAANPEIPPSKLSVLAAMCRYEAFDVGETVFQEGSDADKLFLVLSGVAKVIAKSDLRRTQPAEVQPVLSEKSVALKRSFECSGDQRPLTAGVDITIAELKSGDYFGETGLVFNINRTCSVNTAEKCLFLTVSKADFTNFLRTCPIAGSLKAVIKQRMVSRLSSLGIPFLDGIPDEMLASLGSSVEINDLPEGEVVFRQEDAGDRFYIVVHGGVKVEAVAEDEGECDEGTSGDCLARETTLGSLGPGQYFGEMSLLSDSHRRSATVTTTQKSILLSADKDSFHSLLGHNNNILAEFELRLLNSKAKLKHILGHSLGIASFREFLESEHAGENIDFWIAAKEFEAYDEEDAAKRNEQAKRIFVTFCAEYADRQVNIPHDMLASLKAAMGSGAGEVPRDLFDGARKEIFRLLEKDGFRRGWEYC